MGSKPALGHFVWLSLDQQLALDPTFVAGMEYDTLERLIMILGGTRPQEEKINFMRRFHETVNETIRKIVEEGERHELATDYHDSQLDC